MRDSIVAASGAVVDGAGCAARIGFSSDRLGMGLPVRGEAYGIGLSPEVEAALPVAIGRARAVLESMLRG